MSNSIKKRIIEPLISTAIALMISCILHKILLAREDWIEWSLMFALAWGVGHFIRNSIGSTEVEFWDYFFDTLEVKLAIVCLSIITITFVTSSVLALANWYAILLHIGIPFSVSVFQKK